MGIFWNLISKSACTFTKSRDFLQAKLNSGMNAHLQWPIFLLYNFGVQDKHSLQVEKLGKNYSKGKKGIG